jgi:flagellar biosynthesis protein
MTTPSEDQYHKEHAIALRWDGHGAPVVAATGAGTIAAKIRELAQAHGVPLITDAALTALLAKVDLGAEIPPALYLAVARVLAFIYELEGHELPAQAQPSAGAAPELKS